MGDISVLQGNPLFSGMNAEEIERAAALMRGYRVSYKKGDCLHYPWNPLPCFGLVLAGAVEVCSDDFAGNRMIMADVRPGTSFGESLCFLKIDDSPVYITALEPAEVLWLDPSGLFAENEPSALRERFARLLAERTLSMNNRIQVLSRLTIREKLTVYFSEMTAKYGNTFEIPMNREDLAIYIGANRSSLSRELSAMKKDGLIDFRKNSFTVHTKG